MTGEQEIRRPQARVRLSPVPLLTCSIALRAIPLYRSRHGTADETIEPVVVRPQWFEAPFTYVAAVSVGEGGSLRPGDVLGEERVVSAFRAVQRQGTTVAWGGGEPRVDKRLPVVGVDQDVRELAASAKNGDRHLRLRLRSQSPFLAVGFAGLAPVAAHRLAAGGYADAFRQYHCRATYLVLDGFDYAWEARMLAGLSIISLSVDAR